MTILLFGATKDIIGTPTLSVPTASLSGKKIPNTVGELKKFFGKYVSRTQIHTAGDRCRESKLRIGW